MRSKFVTVAGLTARFLNPRPNGERVTTQSAGEGVVPPYRRRGRGLALLAAPSPSQPCGLGPSLSPLGRGDFKLFVMLLILPTIIGPHAAAAPSAELEAAGNLFSITCSSSFCHGEGGIGARGPSLHNRDFPPNYVRTTIMNGRSGTPMPSFKDALTDVEITLIANYVMSLSPENKAGQAENSAVAPASPAAPAALALSDQAARGQELFFDQTRASNCVSCHSYGAKGGPVGPDLSAIAAKPAGDIYQAIVKPGASTEGYSAVTVTVKDGGKFSGIKRDQNDQQIGLYDVSAPPPVLRSFYFADGIKVEPASGGPLYKHDLTGYAKAEIADLVAFLKSANGAKPVSPQELGLQ